MVYKLCDLAKIKYGKNQSKVVDINGKYPIYGTGGLMGYAKEFLYDKPSVLIGRKGTIDKVRFIDSPFWTVDTLFYTIINENIVYPQYFYYLLKNVDLTKFNEGTTIPSLRTETLNRIELEVPNKRVQSKIISLIGGIDEKIRLNNDINDNLYEQMYSIYKSWFELYEQNNGVKPDSWIRVSIYEITNVIYGAPFSSKLFNEEKNGRPIIRIRDLKSQNFNTYTPEIHPKGYLLQKGDIVVGMDGEFRPYIWGNEEAWLNQRVCVFDNKRPRGKAFLFFTIKPLLKFIEDTEAATTVKKKKKNDFDKFNFIMPDEKTMNEYDEITFPMYDQILNNMLENIRLIKLRDSLLPKLMSGEIDVSNIKLDL